MDGWTEKDVIERDMNKSFSIFRMNSYARFPGSILG